MKEDLLVHIFHFDRRSENEQKKNKRRSARLHHVWNFMSTKRYCEMFLDARGVGQKGSAKSWRGNGELKRWRWCYRVFMSQFLLSNHIQTTESDCSQIIMIDQWYPIWPSHMILAHDPPTWSSIIRIHNVKVGLITPPIRAPPFSSSSFVCIPPFWNWSTSFETFRWDTPLYYHEVSILQVTFRLHKSNAPVLLSM